MGEWISIIARGGFGFEYHRRGRVREPLDWVGLNSRRRTKENPGCSRNRDFSLVAPIKKEPPSKRESSCHGRRRLSSASSRNRCLRPVPQFFASVCVAFLPAAWCFIFAAIVIAASSIAARDVVKNPAACSAVRPIVATNCLPKGVRIIATASASTESVSAPA